MIFMPITLGKSLADMARRREQKDFLRKYYTDYDPVHHDAFVMRFNREMQEQAEKRYRENRGIE